MVVMNLCYIVIEFFVMYFFVEFWIVWIEILKKFIFFENVDDWNIVIEEIEGCGGYYCVCVGSG